MWPKGLTNKGAGTAASCHCHQLRGQVDGDQAPTHSPQHVQRWDVQAWVGQHAREGSPKSPDRHVAQKQVNDACSTLHSVKGCWGCPCMCRRQLVLNLAVLHSPVTLSATRCQTKPAG